MTRNGLRAPLLGVSLLTLAVGVTAPARMAQVQDPAQLPQSAEVAAPPPHGPEGHRPPAD